MDLRPAFRRLTRNRYLPTVLILFLGFILSATLFRVSRGWEKERFFTNFKAAAVDQADELKAELDETIDAVETLGVFFDIEGNVDRGLFREFVSRAYLRKKTVPIQALEWIPRVRYAEASKYVNAARADGIKDFKLTEFGRDGSIAYASKREEYYPVYYVEPVKGNLAAAGFDLSSNPERLKALNESRDTGSVVATSRIRLVQETGGQYGFLLFRPLYSGGLSRKTAEERRRDLTGFVLGVFRVGDILEKSMDGMHHREMGVYVFDESAPPGKRFLAYRSAAGASPGGDINEEGLKKGLYHSVTLDFAGKKWQVLSVPERGYVASDRTAAPFLFFASGLVFTAFSSVFTSLAINRAQRSRSYAMELKSAKELLEYEVKTRRSAEEKLAHMAYHDTLTGLPNRAQFMEILQDTLEGAKPEAGHMYDVLFLDLDRFKYINDSYGHQVGDRMLEAVSNRLIRCVRSRDTVARLGGDEFVLLLGSKTSDDATQCAERIKNQLSQPYNLNGITVTGTVSIGIVRDIKDYHSADELMRDADTAMYQAKTSGRGRYEVFNISMHDKAVETLKLEVELREALEKKEFRVLYQPIYSLKTGRIAGSETLLRWENPRRGLLAPVYFLRLSEETGLINRIGDWVIKESARQNMIWQKMSPGLKVAVNLSPMQFVNHGLHDTIDQALKETGLAPDTIELEIGEKAAVEQVAHCHDSFKRIREAGVRVVLKGHGAGYTSIANLKRLSADAIKLGVGFVKDLSIDKEAGEISKAIVATAHIFNLSVIAEGVETEETLEVLKAQGCDYAQGYLLGYPMTAGEFGELLASGKTIKI